MADCDISVATHNVHFSQRLQCGARIAVHGREWAQSLVNSKVSVLIGHIGTRPVNVPALHDAGQGMHQCAPTRKNSALPPDRRRAFTWTFPLDVAGVYVHITLGLQKVQSQQHIKDTTTIDDKNQIQG